MSTGERSCLRTAAQTAVAPGLIRRIAARNVDPEENTLTYQHPRIDAVESGILAVGAQRELLLAVPDAFFNYGGLFPVTFQIPPQAIRCSRRGLEANHARAAVERSRCEHAHIGPAVQYHVAGLNGTKAAIDVHGHFDRDRCGEFRRCAGRGPVIANASAPEFLVALPGDRLGLRRGGNPADNLCIAFRRHAQQTRAEGAPADCAEYYAPRPS